MNKLELHRFLNAMKHFQLELSKTHKAVSIKDLHLVQAGMRAMYLSEAVDENDLERAEDNRAVLKKLFDEIEPASGRRLKVV